MAAGAHPTPADFRRRRLIALVLLAVTVAALMLFVSSLGGDDPERASSSRSPSEPAATPPATTAQDRDEQPPLAKELGQKVMSRMSGTTPGQALLRRVRQGRIGGVILFADNVRSVGQVRTAVRRLQAAARDGGNPPLLIAVDQEGGDVKRFASLPPSVSPQQMAARGSARREGERTARALRRAGVTLDLAPVVDVPQVANSFLGTRAFGRSASAVARHACAFSAGLKAGGVAPTLKHFPGLGTAGANTDFEDVTIPASAGRVRAAYAPYERCAKDGLVMIANARYPKLTGSRPAVLARSTYTRELKRIGFEGVTISDDLQAKGIDPISDLAAKSAIAGLDIALYAKTERAAARAFVQLERAVRDGRLTEEQVRASAARIRALKEQLAG